MKKTALYKNGFMYWGMRLLPCAVVLVFAIITAGCVSLQAAETSSEMQELEEVVASPDTRVDNIIEFSGYKWSIKESSVLVGPGPNFFSAARENIWVDEQGRMHLKITRTGGEWVCAEVGCEEFLGYGTYVFYMASRVDKVNPNAVAGLFTWDNNTYQSQANCEIDIEFTCWRHENTPNLHYSVQPVRGPEGRYTERFNAAHMELSGLYSTHVFTWTPDGIAFASFDGRRHPTPYVIESWAFDAANNVPRRAGVGENISDPVLVPEPGPDTRIRINLWLVDGNGDGKGDAPRNDEDVEIIIERFEFFPMD